MPERGNRHYEEEVQQVAPSLDMILRQFHPIHILTSYFPNILLDVIFPFPSVFQADALSKRFLHRYTV
jgi:hypothetical protein